MRTISVSNSWNPSGRFPRIRRERLILAGAASVMVSIRLHRVKAPSRPQDKIIVALDVPDTDGALRLLDSLGEPPALCKVGLEAFHRGGILRREGRPVARKPGFPRPEVPRYPQHRRPCREIRGRTRRGHDNPPRLGRSRHDGGRRKSRRRIGSPPARRDRPHQHELRPVVLHRHQRGAGATGSPFGARSLPRPGSVASSAVRWKSRRSAPHTARLSGS